MPIYFDHLLSADLGLPYMNNQGRKTIMHTDTLTRFSHPDAGKYQPADLRLEGGESPGWWNITSTVHPAKSLALTV